MRHPATSGHPAAARFAVVAGALALCTALPPQGLALAAPAGAAAPATPSASTGIPKTAIGFSKLIVRLDGRDEIGIVGDDYRVRLLERMRAKGFHAVGAEDLVFGKDESRSAAFVVGGTVRELECRHTRPTLSCRIGVQWQLLDVDHEAIVYDVTSRAAVLDLPAESRDRMAGLLLTAAIDRLLEREKFRKALGAQDEPKSAAPAFTPATLARCAAGRKLSETAEDLLARTVVVKTASGFGSGFFVSGEGLAITAAHVLEGPKTKLRLRDGSELDALAVRVAKGADVALLRTEKPLSGHVCASVRSDAPPIGAEVYAAGSPASLELAFSLTRGIVSGLPEIDGRRRLQTDAPLNPGNSGGPLADAQGDVVGVVSFKLVGGKIEGVGFAIPIADALASLGLRLGDATDASLSTELATMTSPAPVRVHDEEDPVPSIDPEADRARAMEEERARRRADLAAREAERDRRTPAWVPAMRWSGAIVGVVGGAFALISYLDYDAQRSTQPEFRTLRAENVLGWTAFGVGAAAFTLSYVFVPKLPESSPAKAAAGLQIGVGWVAFRGTF
jgi:S1-C subfamily serine protease